MRRLYSTFAGGLPGLGLVLMRLVVGSVLVGSAASNVWTDQPSQTTFMAWLLMLSGLLLIAGLWTPVVGTVVAAISLSQMLAMDPNSLVPLLAGTIGAALAMLGPGRWSVDARLFGWKRVEALPRARSRSAL